MGQRHLKGRTLQQIADARAVDPRDTYLDLLRDSGLRVLGGTHSMCEDDVRFVMRHPLTMVGSDSRSMKIGGKSAEGVEVVIHNGRVVVDGDRHTGALAVRVLRGH